MFKFNKPNPLLRKNPVEESVSIIKQAVAFAKKNGVAQDSLVMKASAVCADAVAHHREALKAAVDVIALLEKGKPDEKEFKEEIVRRVQAFKQAAIIARLHQENPEAVKESPRS